MGSATLLSLVYVASHSLNVSAQLTYHPSPPTPFPQTHSIPLLVDPSNQALAAFQALRKGVYWYRFTSATPNLAHELFKVLHDGGCALLQLHGDPGEPSRLQPVISALRAHSRTASIVSRYPRPLVAYTNSLCPTLSEVREGKGGSGSWGDEYEIEIYA